MSWPKGRFFKKLVSWLSIFSKACPPWPWEHFQNECVIALLMVWNEPTCVHSRLGSLFQFWVFENLLSLLHSSILNIKSKHWFKFEVWLRRIWKCAVVWQGIPKLIPLRYCSTLSHVRLKYRSLLSGTWISFDDLAWNSDTLILSTKPKRNVVSEVFS